MVFIYSMITPHAFIIYDITCFFLSLRYHVVDAGGLFEKSFRVISIREIATSRLNCHTIDVACSVGSADVCTLAFSHPDDVNRKMTASDGRFGNLKISK